MKEAKNSYLQFGFIVLLVLFLVCPQYMSKFSGHTDYLLSGKSSLHLVYQYIHQGSMVTCS